MKATIDGKRYDTERCEKLAQFDLRTTSNDYAGNKTLFLAKDGTYLVEVDANGHDGWLQNDLYECESTTEFLEGIDLTDEEEQRLVELGLIQVV